MGEAVGDGALVAPDGWEVVIEFDREVGAVSAFGGEDVLHASAEGLADVECAVFQFGRVRKVVDLVNDSVEAIHLGRDELAEFGSEVGVVVALGEELREGLDGDERVADFVGHAGGQLVPKCGALELFLLFLEGALRGDVLNDCDGAEALGGIAEAARLHIHGAAGEGIGPGLRELEEFAFDCAANHVGEAAAEDFDGLSHGAFGCEGEQGLGGCAEPSNDALLVCGYDAGGERVDEGFGEGFLARDLFVEDCVFQGGGDVADCAGDIFEVGVLEWQAGGAVADENPADHPPARVERGNDFRGLRIEISLKERAVGVIGDGFEGGARDEMGMAIHPEDECVCCGIAEFCDLAGAAQGGGETVGLAGLALYENAGAHDFGCGGDAFDDAVEHGVDVAEVVERASEVAQGEGFFIARRARFGGWRRALRLAFQSLVLHAHQKEIECAREKVCELAAIGVQRFEGIDAAVFGDLRGDGARIAERDDGEVGVAAKEVGEGVGRFAEAQVEEENGGGESAAGVFQVFARFRKIGFGAGVGDGEEALAQLRIARVNEDGRRGFHGATSAGASGKRRWKVDPLPGSLSTSRRPLCSEMML